MRRRVGKSVADWDDISILKRIGNALFSGISWRRRCPYRSTGADLFVEKNQKVTGSYSMDLAVLLLRSDAEMGRSVAGE